MTDQLKSPTMPGAAKFLSPSGIPKNAGAVGNDILREILVEQRKTNLLLERLVATREKDTLSCAETTATAVKRAEDADDERV